MEDYKERFLYKLYLEDSPYYYDSPAKARQNLQELFMGPACENYAKEHPDSPFCAELLAIAALLDASPGSFAWSEHYQKKFSSPDAVWSSAKRKMRKWIETHKGDADVLTLLAAAVRLSYSLEDNNYPAVSDYLYQALLSGSSCKCGNIWSLTAWCSGLHKYLSTREQRIMDFRQRDAGAYTEDKNIIPVRLSWILFFLSVAAICYPFLNTDGGSISINRHAVWQFSYKNTIGITVTSIMLLCCITKLKNVSSQSTAFTLCMIWTAIYSYMDFMSTAYSMYQITGKASDYNASVAFFMVTGGRTLMLIPIAIVAGDIGKHIYLIKHLDLPDYYSQDSYGWFDYPFLIICAGVSICSIYVLSNYVKVFEADGGDSFLNVLPYIVSGTLVFLRRYTSDRYVIHAWYAVGLALCNVCIVTQVIYQGADVKDFYRKLFFVMIISFFCIFSENVEALGYIYGIILCFGLFNAGFVEYAPSYGITFSALMQKGALSISVKTGIIFAFYITLREIIFSAAVKKRTNE